MAGGIRVPAPKTAFDKLAANYRVEQAKVSAQTALRVGSYWKGVEVGNEESEAIFVQLAVEELAAGFRRTRDGAIDFTRETLGEDPVFVEPNLEQMAVSMTYVGPIQARRAMGAGEDFEITPAQARRKALTSVEGAGVRLSALGGRETAVRSMEGKRVGYVRVTGFDPCAFCAMLASRRAVYEADSFDYSDARFDGWGEVKVHDNCQCVLIGVTEMSADQLTQMNYWEKVWRDLSGKDPKPGEDPTVTFRRNYDQLRNAA